MSKRVAPSLRPTSGMTPEDQANLVSQMSEEVMKSLEPTLESRFGTVLQSISVLAKLTEMNQPHDAKHLLQRSPVIRYVLDGQSDQERVNGLNESQILCLLQRAGEPFNQIIQAGYSGKELRFTAKSESAEMRIRAVAGDINMHLGLSPNCRAIPQPYFVCAVNVSHEQCPEPRSLKDTWSDQNQVEIANAFWARKNLVLTLFELEHAKKLVSEGIFLGDNCFSYVMPFELQSVPKFCYKCYKPNHLMKECQAKDFRCGRCAEAHDTRGCLNSSLRCPNCGKEHEAWFPQCSSRQVQDMRALCKQWGSQGPSWATLSAREEMDRWLKAMTGPSRLAEGEAQPKEGKGKGKASKGKAPKDQAPKDQASSSTPRNSHATRSKTADAAAGATGSGDVDKPQAERRGPGRPPGSKNKNKRR